jgi:probable F420-dependent oxidoreductase
MITGLKPSIVSSGDSFVYRPFRFAIFAYNATSRHAWEEKARRAEALGYSTLVMPDHFLNPLTPVPALAAAAAVTSTLRIGSIVFSNDYRHPALLAKEAATLDLLSDGRFEFGLGAGWYQIEYDKVGITFDPAGTRIERMIESLEVVRGLWSVGPFTFAGQHYSIDSLDGLPKPVQRPHPPIFVGGTGKRMLQLAAREADIVGLLPKNLPQGGHDWKGSTIDVLDEQIRWVREAAGERFPSIELSYVAFRAVVTADRWRTASSLAPHYDLTPEQLLASPDFLIGTADEIVDILLERRERFGISYIEIDDRDSIEFAQVVARLAGK